jgi:antitoxin ParD1/3/4
MRPASGVSRYLRHLIRQDQSTAAERRLEALLLEGLASGEGRDVTPEFWEEKRRDLLRRFRREA